MGAKYSIIHVGESEDKRLKNCNGYCDWTCQKIVVEKCKPDDDTLEDLKLFEKKVLRHEIVHAFMFESGLNENSMRYDGGWAKNEEMVDWFAIQGPKIYAAWQEAGAL